MGPSATSARPTFCSVLDLQAKLSGFRRTIPEWPGSTTTYTPPAAPLPALLEIRPMMLLKHSSTCSNCASVLRPWRLSMSSCTLLVRPAVADVYVYLEHLISLPDDFAYHMPGKCDGYLFRCHPKGLCLVFLKVQCSLDVGGSRLVHEDQLRISKYLPIARVPLPGAHRGVTVKYFQGLFPFAYRRQSRYGLSSPYTTCAYALCPSDKFPFTARLFHHRLAIGRAELDCCGPYCMFARLLGCFGSCGLRRFWLRYVSRARHCVGHYLKEKIRVNCSKSTI